MAYCASNHHTNNHHQHEHLIIYRLLLHHQYHFSSSSEEVSRGGRVLRDSSAMVAEREALQMRIQRLAVLMPTKVSLFDFEIENLGRTVQHKLDAQSLWLFGQHG